MKRIISLLVCLTFSSILYAQEPLGTWYGNLDVQGTKLSLIFHLTKTGDNYSSTMDSPQQKAMGIPMGKTTYINRKLIIEAPNMGIKYTATFLPEQQKITGTFEQGGLSIPLVLNSKPDKSTITKLPVRPQDPKDFPYKQEEVSFSNNKGGDTLAGTLTIPADGKASKIVVLITGSGPQNRNEELLNHRPFLVLSDWLTRNGIAVLRYDDRGIGKSTGNFNTATSADFADDAEAAVSYIASRPDLKKLSVGLIGHSEGGMIAPMVASRNKSVKFIVLMAGPGIPIAQLMIQQNKDVAKLTGVPDAAIAKSTKTNAKLYAAITQYKTFPSAIYNEKIDSIVRSEISLIPVSELQGKTVDELVLGITSSLKTPWMRYFISFDPTAYLTKVKCPVLALNGSLDSQVASDPNLTGIKNSLQKAGNKKFEIVPMQGLNHLFQKAKTGSPNEYEQIGETINPLALEKITNWIKST
nr:alpha/beta hydrolase [Pedobacter panaciterrae]